MMSENHDAKFLYKDSLALADAIGSLFINFALFNSHLNSALTALYGLNIVQARSFILPMHPRSKIEGIKAFTNEHWKEGEREYLKELCSTALELTNYRNKIAHGDMILSEGSETVSLATYTGKNRFNPKLTPIPPAVVSHNAMTALYLGKEFLRLAVCISQGEAFEKPNPDAQ